MKKTKQNNLKNKLIIKIIISIILTILIVSTGISSFAFYEGERVVVKEGTKVPILMKFGEMQIICSLATISKHGENYFAYCIEASKDGVEVLGDYNLTIDKKITDNRIYSVLKHGYPNKSPSELGVNNAGEAFLATKQAIYTLIYDRSVNQYSGMDSAAGKRTYEAYKKIVANAKQYPYQKFTANLKLENSNEWVITDDNKYIEKEIIIQSNVLNEKLDLRFRNNHVNAEILEENQIILTSEEVVSFDINDLEEKRFKIRVPIENLNESGGLEIEIETGYSDTIAYEAKPDVSSAQKVAVIGVKEDLRLNKYLNIRYDENKTKLEILKIDEKTEEPLSYVSFNIYDENRDLVYENIRTDEDGRVILENMNPGKYFIKEISTKKGYSVLEEEIEIDLKFNESNFITIANKIIPEEPKVEKEVKIIKTLPKTGL